MRTFKRMKMFLAVLSLAVCLTGFTNVFGATVAVTSPNGGETWAAGTMNAITYTSDIIGNVRITLLKGGVQYSLIAGNVPNTGTFNWQTPVTMAAGTDFTVKVASCTDPTVFDASDANFTITGGAGSVIAVTAPNGGETFTAGTANAISWTSDVTGNVKIVLLKNGLQYSLIASSIANTGTFNWLIPAGMAQGTDYKVKISSVANPLISDISDATFTINAGGGTTMTVTAPNGGETWAAGTSNTISWTSDVVGNVRIALLKGGVQCALIASMVPNTGTFNWMIPATVVTGTDYTVKISSGINPLISDVSDANFTINGAAPTTIAITAPNGGETWTAGTYNNITWTSNVIGNVKIVLLKGGVQYSLIASSIPNTGSFSWRIPAGILPGTDYAVKIMKYSNPLINDVSDANFSIVVGGGTSITLIAPNGGETWTAGTANTITWTSDIVGNVRIALLKNGIQFSLIASYLPNTGTFSWNTPISIPTGTDYTVKISSCINPLLVDVSDANFTINGLGGSMVTVTAPNGGETWTAGTANTITWTSDIVGNVRISLLKNGNPFSLIASSVPNSGSFNWMIPFGIVPGSDYTVKVSSVLTPLVNDVSNASFTIVAGTMGSTMTLTAPNGGESWVVGTTNTITWTSDIQGNVRIALLKGGIQIGLVASGTPNDGSHNWLIPAFVIPGTDYKIRISSCINPTISDVSDLDFSIIAADNSTPGTSENSTSKSATGADELTAPVLKLYPNPATDRLNIIADRSMGSVRLINITGQTVYSSSPDSRQVTLNLNGFDAGIYFVKIETEGVVTTHKIIVK